MQFLSLVAILIVAAGLSGANAQSVTITYEYDPIGRLTEVDNSANGVRTYAYDDAHNRTSLTVSGAGPSSAMAPRRSKLSGGGEGNRAPIAEEVTISAVPSSTILRHVTSLAIDPNGDPLVFEIVSDGTLENAGATWRFRAPESAGQTNRMTYTVTDGKGGTSTGTVNVIAQE